MVHVPCAVLIEGRVTVGLTDLKVRHRPFTAVNGLIPMSVREKSSLFKSMLASKNLSKAITKPDDGYHWIRVLAAELALRLKDARGEVPTLWPKTIVLHARQGM